MHTLLALLLVAFAGSAAGFSAPIRPVTRRRMALPRMDFFNDFKKGVAKLQAGLYDEKAMREELEMQIRRKPCVMYSFSSCPFCKQAMEIA